MAEAALAIQGLLCQTVERWILCLGSYWTAVLASSLPQVPMTTCPPLPGLWAQLLSQDHLMGPQLPLIPQTHLHAHLKVDSVLRSESTAGSFEGRGSGLDLRVQWAFDFPLDLGDHVWHSFCGIPPTPQGGLALRGSGRASWDWTMPKKVRSPWHPCLAEWDWQGAPCTQVTLWAHRVLSL